MDAGVLDALLSWLARPWSGAADHAITPIVSWHGRLMTLAWGLAAPLAVVLARYCKVTPGQDWPRELDNPFWWHGHRLLNYAAGTLAAAAAALVFRHSQYAGGARTVHAWLGWSVVALAALQILGAHLRGSKGGPTAPRRAPDGTVIDLHGDHYDMTPRRIVFERVHKSLGYVVLALAGITLLLGLRVADAPRWMWLGLVAWWGLLLGAAGVLQARGKCLDTYQAIWGPDPTLPGASAGPTGWGVRRVGRETPAMTRGRGQAEGRPVRPL